MNDIEKMQRDMLAIHRQAAKLFRFMADYPAAPFHSFNGVSAVDDLRPVVVLDETRLAECLEMFGREGWEPLEPNYGDQTWRTWKNFGEVQLMLCKMTTAAARFMRTQDMTEVLS